MRKALILCIIFLLAYVHADVFAFGRKDARQSELEYLESIYKQNEKEKYERRRFELRKPNPFMTVEEYEQRSAAQDKSTQKIEIPKVQDSDMKYVPQPTYKIVRYNNPPGSPEISIKNDFYKRKQQNSQGIVSPDFSILVYPAMYLYPESNSTDCDLFVIRLDYNETNLNKILKANVSHRLPTPILSTEKRNDEAAFRSLTPVDFSADGRKLLVKEKIGSRYDGIWQTNAIVYDFDNNTSYNLVEIRDAVIYYWKENRNLDLDDSRWDIYPLGFDVNNPNRIVIAAYAYTGREPVFLGLWSIDSHGEQSRLISFDLKDVEIGMNGFKIVQDGVVAPVVLENEEKSLKKIEKARRKAKKEELKNAERAVKDAYKMRIKEISNEFRDTHKDFVKRQSFGGSTSSNDAVKKFKEYKVNQLIKEIEREEKLNEIDLKYIRKLDEKIQKLQP